VQSRATPSARSNPPRASITTLARHFGFDAVESAGVLRFIMRGRAPVAVVGSADMVASGG
jgi:hypothetical protein